MDFLTVQNIVEATSGTYHGPESLLEKEIRGAEMDSRLIEKDFLFIPLKGERVDAHTFIPQVFEAGALITLSDRDIEGVPYIRVKDTEKALRDLATWYRKTLDIPVIGITGSVGKTSTKEVIASVLSEKYDVLKTAGNYNNAIGLPLTILKIRRHHTAAVLEMGISDFGEMDVLTRMAQPTIGVMTNIGVSHMENLKTQAGILKEKSALFHRMTPDGLAILNGDDPLLKDFTDLPCRRVLYGTKSAFPYRAQNTVSLNLSGTKADFVLPNGTFSVTVPVPGEHMVLNALSAAATGDALGLSSDAIKRGIEKLQPVSGRSHLIKTDTFTLIDDCYNANPVSTKAALKTLSGASGRKVAILGDMFELGEKEADLHFETGAFAGTLNIDLLIGIGALSLSTVEGAKKAGTPARHFASIDDFLNVKDDVLHDQDTILIKASNSMHFHRIVEALS